MHETEDAISISEFSFSYPSGECVLDGINWRVAAGSFVLLVGDTGSGKSTLLRSLKPELSANGEQTGRLEVFGRAPKDFDRCESAALIGLVLQDPPTQIVCDVVWHELAFGLENLGVDGDMMRRRVAETAGFFGIEPWMHAQTASLSGGQQQLVNLASILAMQPRLLLLDEPTSQLDPIAEKNFLHALFRINRELGITIVVATHAPEPMADYATAAARLSDGRLSPCDPLTLAAGLHAGDGSTHHTNPVKSSGAAPALRVDDVYFRYARDAQWVLRGADLLVEQGSIHAIVGGNGSGKSTMLRLIAGALKTQRGSVRNAFLERQALLPQDPKALFVCDSVEEELLEWGNRGGYGPEAVAAAMREFGLVGLEARHPFDTSGGQQQKIALAKVLLTKPDLLLLDEPTKGLDAQSKCEVAWTLFKRKAEGCTIVLVTHDLSFVSQVADSVSMLFDGQTACSEPTDEFFHNNIFYQPTFDGFMRLWTQQSASACESNQP